MFAEAQVNPHAIGVRLGGDGGYNNGFEISYQHALGSANRLELDLGLTSSSHHNYMMVAGIYHWDWNLTGGLNWYIGPGAAVGMYQSKSYNSHLGLGIGGQVGLEFDFSTMGAPILLSLDFRPMWHLLTDSYYHDNGAFGWGTALGIRYVW